jgi:hypothetical protein
MAISLREDVNDALLAFVAYKNIHIFHTQIIDLAEVDIPHVVCRLI